MSFTYRSRWSGDIKTLELQTEEISEVKWFAREDALLNAVSYFDLEALKSL